MCYNVPVYNQIRASKQNIALTYELPSVTFLTKEAKSEILRQDSRTAILISIHLLKPILDDYWSSNFTHQHAIWLVYANPTTVQVLNFEVRTFCDIHLNSDSQGDKSAHLSIYNKNTLYMLCWLSFFPLYLLVLNFMEINLTSNIANFKFVICSKEKLLYSIQTNFYLANFSKFFPLSRNSLTGTFKLMYII